MMLLFIGLSLLLLWPNWIYGRPRPSQCRKKLDMMIWSWKMQKCSAPPLSFCQIYGTLSGNGRVVATFSNGKMQWISLLGCSRALVGQFSSTLFPLLLKLQAKSSSAWFVGKVPFGSREKYLLVLGRNEVTLLLCGYENHHTHGKATKSLLQCGLDYTLTKSIYRLWHLQTNLDK